MLASFYVNIRKLDFHLVIKVSLHSKMCFAWCCFTWTFEHHCAGLCKWGVWQSKDVSTFNCWRETVSVCSVLFVTSQVISQSWFHMLLRIPWSGKHLQPWIKIDTEVKQDAFCVLPFKLLKLSNIYIFKHYGLFNKGNIQHFSMKLKTSPV